MLRFEPRSGFCLQFKLAAEKPNEICQMLVFVRVSRAFSINEWK